MATNNQLSKTDLLLEKVRSGGADMTGYEQISLTARLAIPAILAQISHVLMEYIDAAMVGRLGAEGAASIGLVATTTWLFWGVCSSRSGGAQNRSPERQGCTQHTPPGIHHHPRFLAHTLPDSLLHQRPLAGMVRWRRIHSFGRIRLFSGFRTHHSFLRVERAHEFHAPLQWKRESAKHAQHADVRTRRGIQLPLHIPNHRISPSRHGYQDIWCRTGCHGCCVGYGHGRGHHLLTPVLFPMLQVEEDEPVWEVESGEGQVSAIQTHRPRGEESRKTGPSDCLRACDHVRRTDLHHHDCCPARHVRHRRQCFRRER